MIIQPTQEQTRRITRKRTYSGPGFGPRSFECFGMGIGLGLGFASVPGAIARAPLSSYFTPANTLQFCQVHIGLSYASVMLATGGGPAAGISGTLSGGTIPKPVKVTITGNGTQTTATYSLSHDRGATVAQTGTCAASVAITALPGLSVTFPAGSYTTSHSYEAVASALADPAGTDAQGYTFTGTARPIIVPLTGGYPGLLFDGVDDTGVNTTLNCPTLTAIRMIYRLESFSTSAAGSLCGPNSNGLSPAIYHSSAVFCQAWSGSAGSTATSAAGTLARVRSLYTPSVGDTLRWGSSTGGAATAGATRAGTGRRIASSGDVASGFTGFANLTLAAIGYFNADPNGAQDTAFDTAAAAFYSGLAV